MKGFCNSCEILDEAAVVELAGHPKELLYQLLLAQASFCVRGVRLDTFSGDNVAQILHFRLAECGLTLGAAPTPTEGYPSVPEMTGPG